MSVGESEGGAPGEAPGPQTIVCVDPSPRIGGATRVLLTTLARLDRGRFRALVVCNAGPVADAFRAHGHEVLALDLPGLTFAGGLRAQARRLAAFRRASWSIARVARGRRAAALYAQGLAAALYAWSAAVFGRVPLVWHAHEMPDARARMRPFVALAAAAAREIVCVSHACAARLLALGAPARKCHVVHNALPVELGGGRDASALPASGEGPLLVSVGALTPAKGHGVLVDAMAHIAARFPAAVALVAGEPLLDDDARHVRQLRERIRRLGLEERVHLLGFRSDVTELLRRATVVVHPSTCEETFGLVPLEGMALGRPIVASRTGGIAEVIADGETGLLVAPGDAAALARAVCELLGDPPRRERMGAAGRRRAAEVFGADAMTRGMNAAFERAISQAPFVA